MDLAQLKSLTAEVERIDRHTSGDVQVFIEHDSSDGLYANVSVNLEIGGLPNE